MRTWLTLILLLALGTLSYGQTDANVEGVFTLGKIHNPLGVYNHVVQARITNSGSTDLVDLPVTLTITGANTFTDIQLVSITVGQSALVSFRAVSLWTTGSNTVTVTVPADANLSNNSGNYSQLVNNNTFSYADNSAPASALGFGTGEGILMSKFQLSGSGKVTQVRVHISNSPGNIGQTVYAVVATFGAILGQSAPHVIAAGDLGAYYTFDIQVPPSLNPELVLFAGLAQISDGATEYYPVSYQSESLPTRPDAYFASLLDASGLTELNFIGRLMIEAVVEIGDEAPFNSGSTNNTNYTLAGWDLSGLNSPASVVATSFDTSLSSSNLLTRGPGAASSPGLHAFRTVGFQDNGIATTNTDYFQVTISPKPGDILALSSISAYVHGNSNAIASSGVNSQFAYSLNGVNFTLIGSPISTTTNIGMVNANLSGIPALQNLAAGTTVTIRYYASGAGAISDWGFISYKPGVNGLAVNGRIVSTASNSVFTSPVVPTGSDFTLADCNSTATGSVNFTSSGTFAPGNQYIVQMGEVFTPHAGIYGWRSPVTVGTLTSTANSGTINFTIPAGTNQSGSYALRVLSTSPAVSGSLSQSFQVKGDRCTSQPGDVFRSKASGKWSDMNTWESQSTNGWIPATLVPDDASSQIEIAYGTTVSITNNVSFKKINVKGNLQLLNNDTAKGMITILAAPFPGPYAMTIDASGVLQVVASQSVYNDAMLYLDGNMRVLGKITVGDGTSPIGTGFEDFAIGNFSSVFWLQGSTFEWNSTTSFPTNGVTYFPNFGGYPTFRMTKIAPGSLGGASETVINAVLEVNTPVTWQGSGPKTFTAGVIGTSTLTQAAGSGKFIMMSPFQDEPASPNVNATQYGVLGGSLNLQLSTQGIEFESGVTVPAGSNVVVSGPCLSKQLTAIQPGASLALSAGSIFSIDNGDFNNEGNLSGPGGLRFTGASTSMFSSPGTITAPTTLVNKQLLLGSHSNISNLSLTASSHFGLGVFDLFMGTATLTADADNFIVTSDTGRLSRYVGATATNFPVGINNDSYSPVNLINAGTSGQLKVGVRAGVEGSVPFTEGFVDRTWIIGDSTQTGFNLAADFQWQADAEQPAFDRSVCYVTHYTGCSFPASCTAYFDTAPAGAATGSTLFSRQRTGLNDFQTNHFSVTSKQFVFTFTGSGDWTNAANWTPAVAAPVTIPPGIEVYINGSGECTYTGNIKIKQGGKLKVEPGKKLNVNGELTIE